MPQPRKNDCPNCETPLNEETVATIEDVWFAGRGLTARVRCGECGHKIVVGATATAHYDETEMDT